MILKASEKSFKVTSRYEKAVHLSWFDFLYPFMLETPALVESK